jgi:hypothetical protein
MSKRVARPGLARARLGPVNFVAGHARPRAAPAAQARPTGYFSCQVAWLARGSMSGARAAHRSLLREREAAACAGHGGGMDGRRGQCRARWEEAGWPWKPTIHGGGEKGSSAGQAVRPVQGKSARAGLRGQRRPRRPPPLDPPRTPRFMAEEKKGAVQVGRQGRCRARAPEQGCGSGTDRVGLHRWIRRAR